MRNNLKIITPLYSGCYFTTIVNSKQSNCFHYRIASGTFYFYFQLEVVRITIIHLVGRVNFIKDFNI